MGLFNRAETVQHVVQHFLGIPFQRAAKTPAARAVIGHNIVFFDLKPMEFGMHLASWVVGSSIVNFAFACSAVLAAENAPGNV